MPTKVVDLRDLVPNDIEFVFDDGSWSIPGDVDNDTVWELYKLLLDLGQLLALTEAKGEDDYADPTDRVRSRMRELSDEMKQVREIDDRMRAILLRLFQRRHPDMKELPFGQKAVRVIAQTVLAEIGFFEESDAAGDDGEDDAPGPRKSGSSGSSRTGSSRSPTKGGSRSRSGGR